MKLSLRASKLGGEHVYIPTQAEAKYHRLQIIAYAQIAQ